MKRINSEVRRGLRVDLCNLYGGRCAYCEETIGMRGTIDHYVPEALGGTNRRSNLRWACQSCNQLKADMPPEEWEQRKPLPRPRRVSRAMRKAQLLQLVAQRGRQSAARKGRP